MNIYIPEIEHRDDQFNLGCFSSRQNAIRAILLYLDNTSLNPLSPELVNRVRTKLTHDNWLEDLEYTHVDDLPMKITASIDVVRFDSYSKCN